MLAMISKRDGNYGTKYLTPSIQNSQIIRFFPLLRRAYFFASDTDRLSMLDAKLNGDKSFD
ncbi:MAG: hypothetical protein IPH11_10125 [Ignavibacteriales bacterium]|nr:hypothetical protein [Ignavibacteriales bacterium]